VVSLGPLATQLTIKESVMFLQANKPLTRILTHGREQNKWTPLKHLYNRGMYPDVNQMVDDGLLHMRHTKDDGLSINLSLKGYKQAKGLLG
jgi:hypothetical protein